RDQCSAGLTEAKLLCKSRINIRGIQLHTDEPSLNLAMSDQLFHDAVRHVDRNSETDSLIAALTTESFAIGQNCGVDADQVSVQVHQRAARIAGIDGSVRLNEVLIVLDTQSTASGGANDAHGRGFADAVRVANSKHDVSDMQIARVAELHRRQIGRVNFEHRDVRIGVGADDFRREFALIGKANFDIGGAVYHVIIREDCSVRGNNDAGAKTLFALALGHHLAAALIAEELLEEGIVEERHSLLARLHYFGRMNVNNRRQNRLENGSKSV